MSRIEDEEVKAFWNRVADDWLIQVGDSGDRNRRENSDPVLWRLLGAVDGLSVLDVGCGTGYLASQLSQHGAQVTGIDFSENMITIARKQSPEVEFLVDSGSNLSTQSDATFDRIVSNYVIMDLPDLDGAIASFRRVLKPAGEVVLVFSHPCFPIGRSFRDGADALNFRWATSYFKEGKRVDPPWDHFKSEFIWFHRPLSDYWKAFRKHGFIVEEFEEPHGSETALPCSVIFKLKKED